MCRRRGPERDGRDAPVDLALQSRRGLEAQQERSALSRAARSGRTNNFTVS
jgi:hypothetical protein